MKTKDILEQEYGELVITEKTRESIKKHPEFYVNSPVKVATARIYTNEEFQKNYFKVERTICSNKIFIDLYNFQYNY